MGNNKKRWVLYAIDAAVIIILFCLFGFAVYLWENNEDLNAEIDRKDALISQMNLRDSLNSASAKEASEVITNYTTKNCELQIDGKVVSMDELLNAYNKAERDLLLLQLEIERQKYVDLDNQRLNTNNQRLYTRADSLATYKYLYNYIQNKYGINVTGERRNDRIYLTTTFSRADSAAITYRYFKDRIGLDTSGKWLIRLSN